MTDVVNVGTGTDTGDGDKARIGGGKINAKFATLDSEISLLTSDVAALEAVTAPLGTPVAITGLPAATLPLGGTETFDIVQGGVNRKTTIAALTGTPGSDTVARTAINTIKSDYCDPRDFVGWDGTGVNGISSILQSASAQAIAANVQLRIPAGLYALDAPFDFGAQYSDGLDMVGVGDPAPGSISGILTNHGSSVFFRSTDVNKPAFYNSRGVRNFHLANVCILGPNTAWNQYQAPNDFKQNYNPGGAFRDTQWSPLCGIAIDAFNRASPAADGGYPGMTAKYNGGGSGNLNGSSGIQFENVSVYGFIVNIGLSFSGTTSNTDTIKLWNCQLGNCDTAIASCSGQTKEFFFMLGGIGSCRQAFDGANYGQGQGYPMIVWGTNLGYLQRIVNYQDGFGPLFMELGYIESVRSLGNYGTGGSTVRGHCSIQRGQFTLDNSAALPPPIFFDTYGLASLRDMNFNSAGGAVTPLRALNIGNDLTIPVKFDSCTFNEAAAATLPLVGLTATGSGVVIDNCLAASGSQANRAFSDNSVAPASAFAANNRFIGTARSQWFANGTGIVEFAPATATGVLGVACTSPTLVSRSVTFVGSLTTSSTGGTLSANWTDLSGWYYTTFPNSDVRPVLYLNGSTTVSWGTYYLSSGMSAPTVTAACVALTFTATDSTLVQVGDIFFWKFLKQGGISSFTQRNGAAWVATVGGASVTCQPMFDTTWYDTVANQPSAGATLSMYQAPWAPTAALTASMNNSTAITAVSPVNLLLAGDWVNAASGIAANSRVVTTDGAGNITLNKATTGGALTGINLYFGRFQTPTVTATW
jgi:hypothetical protein